MKQSRSQHSAVWAWSLLALLFCPTIILAIPQTLTDNSDAADCIRACTAGDVECQAQCVQITSTFDAQAAAACFQNCDVSDQRTYSECTTRCVEQSFSSQSSSTSVAGPKSTTQSSPSSSSTSNTSQSDNESSNASAPSSSSSSSTPVGAIVGGVVGGLVAIAAIMCFLWLYKREQRKKASQTGFSQEFKPAPVPANDYPTYPTGMPTGEVGGIANMEVGGIEDNTGGHGYRR